MHEMRRILALVSLTVLCAFSFAYSQAKGRPSPQFARPDQIDPAEGTKILEAFRSARTNGDYAFAFELVNKPFGGSSQTFSGVMLGTWTEDGRALTRTDVTISEGRTLHLVYKGGPDGCVLKSENDGNADAIVGKDRFKPIIDGVTFTTFELQTPFVYWTDYVYEGTRKLMGRPAHYFILYPPEGFENDSIAAVRVAIDADFMALLFAEELDKGGKSLKSFRINDFAKVDGQWILREMDLVDSKTKDRTRFKVINARVGSQLPPEVFKPDADGRIPAMDPSL
jgi:hypothetical protein